MRALLGCEHCGNVVRGLHAGDVEQFRRTVSFREATLSDDHVPTGLTA
jgi:hypothetical protein